ncbi:unnamed protein product [Camellia sinensis]
METIIHSLTFLGIFQQSKHQTHSFSSSRIQNPDANSITEPLPTTCSSQSTQETHVSNNATPSGGSKFTDVISSNKMITNYIRSGDLDSALRVIENMTSYVESGDLDSALELFWAAQVKSVTWNAVISGYVENCQPEDALKLFRTMVELGVKPNPSSLSSVLLGCSNLSAMKLDKQIHQLTCKSVLCLDTTVVTSLISVYCKCGDLNDPWKLFLEMPRRDVVTWNAMISGYAQHGAGEKSRSLFDEIRHEGIKPDWITYVGVLSACNHAGLVDLGIQYFDTMSKDYGVEAKRDHYTCMVDLLGRAGKLIEANLDLAEFAAKNLLDLDPMSAAGYVQLANVYAAMNRWDNVARVRRSMKENKEIRVHPELKLIREKLNEVEKKMKLEGYVPDLDFALHDVGEEQKEKLLLWHSKKLAIAYGLIRILLGTPIQVFKNLRVCGDCHRATMYISAIERRKIIGGHPTMESCITQSDTKLNVIARQFASLLLEPKWNLKENQACKPSVFFLQLSKIFIATN